MKKAEISIVGLLFALVVLFSIASFFLPTGIVGKLPQKVYGVLVFMGFAKPDYYANQEKVDPAIAERFKAMISNLRQLSNANGPCFSEFIPGDLGKQHIEIASSSGKTSFQLMGTNQVLDIATIDGLSLCVVAGEKDGNAIAANFRNTFINPDGLHTPYSLPLTTATLKGQTTLSATLSDDKTTKLVDRNIGMFFVPKKGEVCVMPYDNDLWHFDAYGIRGKEDLVFGISQRMQGSNPLFTQCLSPSPSSEDTSAWKNVPES